MYCSLLLHELGGLVSQIHILSRPYSELFNGSVAPSLIRLFLQFNHSRVVLLQSSKCASYNEIVLRRLHNESHHQESLGRLLLRPQGLWLTRTRDRGQGPRPLASPTSEFKSPKLDPRKSSIQFPCRLQTTCGQCWGLAVTEHGRKAL